MNLPAQTDLPISSLAQLFNSTTASYKFLLFKAIFDCACKDLSTVKFSDLALRSIAQAWYSIHFYKLSYGYSDKMKKWINDIHSNLDANLIISDLHYDRIYDALKEIYENGGDLKLTIQQFIDDFSTYVPYRLLTPFFEDKLVGVPDHTKNNLIAELSPDQRYKSLYSIEKTKTDLILKIAPQWLSYLQRNMAIIEGWWRENFIAYLQKNNPTALSIVTKLDPPIQRNMIEVKKEFKSFFEIYPAKKKCLYSGLALETVSHDHFYPWSFLGSDPIYNFVPSLKNINSSKNDKIPHHDYLKTFAEFQFNFYEFLAQKEKKAVEHYLNDLKINTGISRESFIKSVLSFYEPLYLTAKNQGFVTNWKYKADELG